MKLIKLTQGQFAKVDDEDFEFLSQWNWYARYDKRTNKYYVGRGIQSNHKRTNIHLHRVIMNTPIDMETDHIDGNPLNCQKYNLRNVTRSLNMRNKRKYKNQTSKYKGVGVLNRNYKLKNGEIRSCPRAWQAKIQVDKKQIYLGFFDSEEKAAVAYNEAAKKYHGEFANLNQI